MKQSNLVNNDYFEQVPSLEDQIASMNGTVKYISKPTSFIPRRVFNNTSILKVENSYMVTQRVIQNRNKKLTENWRQNPSTTILGKINKNFDNFKIILEINLLKEFSKSFEDARLVSFQDNEVTLIGTVWNFDQKKVWNSRQVAHQAILKLNLDGEIVFFSQPAFGQNLSINKYEKNWVPIIGSTNFVYSLNPNHIVFDLGKGNSFESPGISWEFGTPHCGSQVIELPDYYFAIYHSSIETAVTGIYSEQAHFVRRYFIGAYKFSKSSPFSIIQSTKVPILTASLNNPFVKNSPISLLAHGLTLDNKHLVITLGVNDAASAIIRLPIEEITKLLVEN